MTDSAIHFGHDQPWICEQSVVLSDLGMLKVAESRKQAHVHAVKSQDYQPLSLEFSLHNDRDSV